MCDKYHTAVTRVDLLSGLHVDSMFTINGFLGLWTLATLPEAQRNRFDVIKGHTDTRRAQGWEDLGSFYGL